MKAKKLTGGALKLMLIGAVGAFLALHSINLFRYVFPVDQQYLAWLGFGLTGLGAVAYLTMFLWEGTTVLQRWISLAMAVICSIGEVLAAIFGMQIESWKKAGFVLTEGDFQTMLMVVGLLSVAHFFALIGYFAGDSIAELFADDDGDGTANMNDKDYKGNKGNSNNRSKMPANAPRKPQGAPQGGQNPVYTMSQFLQASGMRTEQAFEEFLDETETFGRAWQVLRDGESEKGYRKPNGITHKNFNELAGRLNGHKVNPT